ncbi:MAG: glycosyltransferase family 39 protein [Bacteroidales bacterium]|nr:glycosyltransferase family 39 protein [Bacteroidales bacterium]
MKKAALYLLVGAIFLALVSGSLLTTGMFMDGLIYSNIAANMAEGVGSFWHPVYTATHHPDFYIHPPLALGLLALFYKVLGVQLWVTKLYTVITTLLCALLIYRLWLRLGGKKETGWMPLLIWTLIPVVTRFANQCMLENTMVLFDLGAILLLLRPNHKALNGLLAGLLLAAAFMTKGFTGLFPLVLPLLLWLFDRRKGMPAQTLAMVAGLLLPLAVIVLAVPEARTYFSNYMEIQVLAGWSQGEVQRWQILLYFLRNIVIVVVVVAVVVLGNKGVGWKPTREQWALWALVACAVLPMMVSTRQREFYLLTAMPLVAVLLALLIEEPVTRWLKPSTSMFVAAVVACVCAMAFDVLNYGKPGRDALLQRDMKVIAPCLERGELVTVPTPLYFDYKLQGYYYRECRVSLGDQERCRHLLTTAEYPADSTYREVPLPTEEYKLYELKTEKI